MRRRGGVPSWPGDRQTTLAATASCPSRNTVAVIGRCSPTTARAENDPQDTTGATSLMPRRRSARPVIAATLEGPPCPPPLAGEGAPRSPLLARSRRNPAGGCATETGTPSRIGSPRASSPTVHRPRHPAGPAAAACAAGDEPAVVLAPRDARPVRNAGPRAVAHLRRRSGQGARRGLRGAAGDPGQGPPVPAPAAGRRRRPAGVHDLGPVVPVAGGRRPAVDRVLLRRVRHHGGAAAVLRRPGHPRRRPPQGRLGPRRPADRRRPALPGRLLRAGPVGRRLAAGALPVAGPARAAGEAAARQGRRRDRHLGA